MRVFIILLPDGSIKLLASRKKPTKKGDKRLNMYLVEALKKGDKRLNMYLVEALMAPGMDGTRLAIAVYQVRV